jgi:hypothetical protein
MQGIFNVQDLFLSSERFNIQQQFNGNDQNHVHTFHQTKNIEVVSPYKPSPFQKMEQLNEDDKFKVLNSKDFNIIQIKETNHDNVSQNQNSIKSCISGSTRPCLGNYL